MFETTEAKSEQKLFSGLAHGIHKHWCGRALGSPYLNKPCGVSGEFSIGGGGLLLVLGSDSGTLRDRFLLREQDSQTGIFPQNWEVWQPYRAHVSYPSL